MLFMWTVLLSLMLFAPQLTPGTPAQQTPVPVRTEKLTPDEQKQLKDAKAEVADAQAKADAASKSQDSAKSDATTKAASDAQMKLEQARRELQGTEDGISLAHHANTECGCYVQSQGRDYDRVEFKDDTIVIRHVHEGPPALH
jgi:outer membrane biosynthesis protein TonB